MNPRWKIDKIVFPGIFGNSVLIQIAAVSPFGGDIAAFRLFNEGLQSLFGAWIDAIIKFVQFKSGFQGGYIDFGFDPFGFFGASHDFGPEVHGQNTQYDDDNH